MRLQHEKKKKKLNYIALGKILWSLRVQDNLFACNVYLLKSNSWEKMKFGKGEKEKKKRWECIDIMKSVFIGLLEGSDWVLILAGLVNCKAPSS